MTFDPKQITPNNNKHVNFDKLLIK